jgi:hypothetical protein
VHARRESSPSLATGLPAFQHPREDGPVSSVPRAQVEGLEVNETKDGVIVFDPRSDRVHYLNSTAALVFTMCDGEEDAVSIAEFMASAFELDEPPLANVEECLRALVAEDLVT